MEKAFSFIWGQTLVGGNRLTALLADADLQGRQHRKESLVEEINQSLWWIDPNLKALRGTPDNGKRGVEMEEARHSDIVSETEGGARNLSTPKTPVTPRRADRAGLGQNRPHRRV